jgi:hypothetical protein
MYPTTLRRDEFFRNTLANLLLCEVLPRLDQIRSVLAKQDPMVCEEGIRMGAEMML